MTIIEFRLDFLSMADAKKTVLFEKHTAFAAKSQIVPFSGWLMPLWYQSAAREHEAVRKTAGLFDCTHMAVLGITGETVKDFLNSLTTNDVSLLKPGKAQYSYILNFEGDIIDDVIIYCFADDNYIMVVNAANEQRVKDWIAKVRIEKILIDSSWQFDPIRDNDRQRRPVSDEVEIKDLKNPSLPDAKVDIAIQGPASAQCLKNIFNIDVGSLKPFTFVQAKTKDFDLVISRTGYTGAKMGFEVFVHPNKAGQLWDTILEKGKNLGVIPCGLASRDSLRIEAGLPLYGHELAGEFNISPFQAGYGWAVKLQKPDFIGKKVIAKKADFNMEVARLEFDGSKGIRPIRQFDGILSNGICIGHCLSCAAAGDRQIVLSLIEKQYNIIDNPAGIYYLARNQSHIQQGRCEKVNIGDNLKADLAGKVIERFEKF